MLIHSKAEHNFDTCCSIIIIIIVMSSSSMHISNSIIMEQQLDPIQSPDSPPKFASTRGPLHRVSHGDDDDDDDESVGSDDNKNKTN
jgi:hypothetical protein